MGKDLAIFGCIIVVVSSGGLYAVITECKKALRKYCVALILLIAMDILGAAVILFSLDDLANRSKKQVSKIFNRRASKDTSTVDDIQRLVSISFSNFLL